MVQMCLDPFAAKALQVLRTDKMAHQLWTSNIEQVNSY